MRRSWRRRGQRRCAVVGSSATLLGAALGSEIDGADFVLAELGADGLEADVGRRTPLRIVTLRPFRHLRYCSHLTEGELAVRRPDCRRADGRLLQHAVERRVLVGHCRRSGAAREPGDRRAHARARQAARRRLPELRPPRRHDGTLALRGGERVRLRHDGDAALRPLLWRRQGLRRARRIHRPPRPRQRLLRAPRQGAAAGRLAQFSARRGVFAEPRAEGRDPAVRVGDGGVRGFEGAF